MLTATEDTGTCAEHLCSCNADPLPLVTAVTSACLLLHYVFICLQCVHWLHTSLMRVSVTALHSSVAVAVHNNAYITSFSTHLPRQRMWKVTMVVNMLIMNVYSLLLILFCSILRCCFPYKLVCNKIVACCAVGFRLLPQYGHYAPWCETS
jgi:hypothetical protein